MHHDFPLPVTPDVWAQLVLRAFARTTNALISGQTFRVVAEHRADQCAHIDQLQRLLRGFGAQVEYRSAASLPHVPPPWSGDEATAASPIPQPSPVQATFIVAPSGLAAQDVALRVGGVRVLAPLQGDPVVVNDAGALLLHPYDPAIGVSVQARATYAAHRIEWARSRMPVTRQAVVRVAQHVGLAGARIGLALVLEPKTAVLALELQKASAYVSVFSHADETRDDVAAVLRDRGISVFAESDATPERDEELARDFLAQELEYLLDDGSHVIRMAHDPQRAPGALTHLVGGAEETTSGLRPLRIWQDQGMLRIPVIASNDARSKTLFDNGYGTGQSCLLTTLDLMDPANEGIDMSTHHVVVIGYGDVGRGCARFATALGARVTVVEQDPVRLLVARMDGHGTAPLEEATPVATILMSATGERGTITVDTLRTLPQGAVVAVAGGVNQEVAIDDALTLGAHFTPVASPSGGIARHIEDLHFPDGHWVRVADRGGCINCTAGEGNPIEIMDLSFAVQVGAIEELLTHGATLTPGLHPLPAVTDDAVSAAALHAWTQPRPAAAAHTPHSTPQGGAHAASASDIDSPKGTL